MLDRTTPGKARILIYTRAPIQGEYPTHLACSIHLAISRDSTHYDALNHNYGILFAASTIGPDNTIQEKALKRPWLFHTADGGFGIAAVRVNADGSSDAESKGKILLWDSRDLCSFREAGLVDLGLDASVEEVACRYDPSIEKYRILWRDAEGNRWQNTMGDIMDTGSVSAAQPASEVPETSFADGPEDAICGNVLEAESRFCDALSLRWSPLHNVAIQVPPCIRASSEADVTAVRATAVYSDGSTARKQVKWETGSVDFRKPGIYEVDGTVMQDEYPFPLAKGYADPDILRWGDKYYFIATNDNTNAVGFYVREADTPAGLFADNVEEHLILGSSAPHGFTKCFWAPEFHVIGGALYLLCALAGEGWGPQSHMMKLKPGGSITDPGSWEAPVRVKKADGANLTEEGITLDMTYLKANGASYLVWSYRKNIFTPLDTGSMLMIASIDETTPWKLTSEPVLLARPLYGWENVDHTINNEGPYAIVTEDTVFLCYSGGAAGGYTYAIGLMTAQTGDDLLNPASWAKRSTPLLSHYSVPNEFGPGHNAFFTDPHGNLVITYHAQESLAGTTRCTAARRVHFNMEGMPVLDLTPERDLNPALAHVRTQIIVQ